MAYEGGCPQKIGLSITLFYDGHENLKMTYRLNYGLQHVCNYERFAGLFFGVKWGCSAMGQKEK